MKIVFDVGRLEGPVLQGLPRLCEGLEADAEALELLGEGIAVYRALGTMARREMARRRVHPKSTAPRSVIVPIERMPTLALLVLGETATRLEHSFWTQGLEFGSAFAELLERHAREECDARAAARLMSHQTLH